MESTSAAASSRTALFLPDPARGRRAFEACWSDLGRLRHLSCSVAVTKQRPDRHRPSCRLQFLRQARDERASAPPASTNASSNPNGVSNTALQIVSTSSHSGLMPASASDGLTSASLVYRARAGVSLRMSSASGSELSQ